MGYSVRRLFPAPLGQTLDEDLKLLFRREDMNCSEPISSANRQPT